MGRLSAKIDYEEIRIARILENQAKLASMGLNKTLADLRAVASSAKSVKSHVRKAPKIYYSGMPLRRSSRLTKASTTESPSGHDSLRRSNRLRGIPRDPISLPQGFAFVFLFVHLVDEKMWERKAKTVAVNLLLGFLSLGKQET
ncbi:hypothetical protein CK203_004181 [Vitis vinifera]|uniref:Uncharacterized protein n=1 Tax=Vitis vinifera TaxID=29760 RepID=A0A438K9M0_VITVI|nr:hypothetical protein CK203_004181 [Vitis vinifera]